MVAMKQALFICNGVHFYLCEYLILDTFPSWQVSLPDTSDGSCDSMDIVLV